MRVGTDAVHPQHAVTLPSHHALRSPWGACTVPHKPVVLSYGDGMRVAAVVAVIGVHASGIGVMRYGRLDPLHWWSVNAVDSLCRWAVPIFIMLSGALLLDPARDEPAPTFYRKRMARVGIPLLVWAWFYFFWTWAFYGERVDRTFVIRALLDGLTYNHLYFLFLILGLYAVAPLLRMYVRRVRRPQQWAVAALVLALVSFGILQNAIPMNALTRFVPFIGYFLVGILLRDVPATTPLRAAALVAFLAATAFIAIGTGQRFASWGPDDWRSLALYDTLGAPVVIQSIAMFILLRSFFAARAGTHPRESRLIRLLAPLVFGIYLVHRAVHDLLAGLIDPLLPAAALPTIVLQIASTFVVAATVVALLRRVPYLRHIVG